MCVSVKWCTIGPNIPFNADRGGMGIYGHPPAFRYDSGCMPVLGAYFWLLRLADARLRVKPSLLASQGPETQAPRRCVYCTRWCFLSCCPQRANNARAASGNL